MFGVRRPRRSVIYQKDALLAATFVPGGSNNEIFAVAGDGQLCSGMGAMSPPPILI